MKELLIVINWAKLKKDGGINANLNYWFKILEDVFEKDPSAKFRPCRDALITKKG